jgi:hypothetical protein
VHYLLEIMDTACLIAATCPLCYWPTDTSKSLSSPNLAMHGEVHVRLQSREERTCLQASSVSYIRLVIYRKVVLSMRLNILKGGWIM